MSSLPAVLERPPSTTETKDKISASKRGHPQSDAHRAARKEGRKPKFEPGDQVLWFDETGIVTKRLGMGSVYGNGRQALWYEVRFGHQTRNLLQEVLTKV